MATKQPMYYQTVLAYVKAHPGLSACQIAKELNARASPVHEQLRRLAEKGLVTRAWDKGGPRGGSTWRPA